ALNNNLGATLQGGGNLFGPVANNAGATLFANAPAAPLMLTNFLGNFPGGQVKVAAGSTLFVNNAWTNLGLVTLLGPGANLGGPLNGGTVYLSDLNSSVYGPVTNTGRIQITANTTTFYGFVNNAAGGTIKTTAAVARYLAGASVGGTYVSDPSDNYFTDLTVTASGVLQGGVGDRFFIAGNYASASTQSAQWNTLGAELRVQGRGSHALSVT